MPKYRKKPMVVEAIQWVPTGDRPPAHIPDKFGVVWQYDAGGNPDGGTFQASGASFRVKPGDWIITDTKRGQSICQRDIFEQTYEPVQE